MNIEEFREYCLSKKHVTESFPFDEQTLVFKVLGKMFALVPIEWWERGKPSINLKCNPDYALELREEYESIGPGFHMSKVHWNTLYLNSGELNTELIFKLTDHSYDLVVKSLPVKLRNKI